MRTRSDSEAKGRRPSLSLRVRMTGVRIVLPGHTDHQPCKMAGQLRSSDRLN